jgi:6-pyruvoyl-tetrahydropterin synthase
MLVDYDVVKREIDAWDHRHLNDEVAFVPTAELLAAEMQRRILHSVKGIVGLDRSAQVGVLLRLWETPSSYAQVGFLTVDPEAAAHPHASAVVNSAPAGTDS